MSPVLSKTRSRKSSRPQLPGFRICQGISLWWECFAWRWDLPGIGGRFFGHVIESPEPLKVFGLGPEELETAHGRVIHRFGSHLGQCQLEAKVSTRSRSHQETWIGFIHSSCPLCVPNVASFMMFHSQFNLRFWNEMGPVKRIVSYRDRKALMANEKLGPLVKGFSSSDLEQIASNAWRLEVQPGEQVVQQGSIKADNFYVVASGHLEVIKDGEKVGSKTKELPVLQRCATIFAQDIGPYYILYVSIYIYPYINYFAFQCKYTYTYYNWKILNIVL